MTTIVAIRTNLGLDSIVVGADRQVTSDNGEKTPADKLFFGKYWAMADCGEDYIGVRRFYGVLRGDKRYGSNEEDARKIIARAIEKKRFYEVDELNAGIMRQKRNIDGTSAFIFAVNLPELSLWRVDEFGNLLDADEELEFEYICLGSGSGEAKKTIQFMVSDEQINRDKVDAAKAICACRRSLDVAMRVDGSTGLGYNMILMTREKIFPLGKGIDRRVEEFREKLWLEEQGKYVHQEEASSE